jgi:hypothetical protein
MFSCVSTHAPSHGVSGAVHAPPVPPPVDVPPLDVPPVPALLEPPAVTAPPAPLVEPPLPLAAAEPPLPVEALPVAAALVEALPPTPEAPPSTPLVLEHAAAMMSAALARTKPPAALEMA